MDFSFNRQSSKDFLFKKSEALKTSFTSGASGMRTGLAGSFSQVQSKLDKISTKLSTSLDLDDDDDEDYLEEKQRLLSEQNRQQRERQRLLAEQQRQQQEREGLLSDEYTQQHRTQQSEISNQNHSERTNQNQSDDIQGQKVIKQKPPKPPLPKQLSRGSIDQNGSIFNDPNNIRRKIPAPSEQEINFNEPLFNEQESIASNATVNSPNAFAAPNGSAVKSSPYPTQRTGIHNPFTNDGCEETKVFADVHHTQEGAAVQRFDINVNNHEVPDLMQRRRTNPFIDVNGTFDIKQLEISSTKQQEAILGLGSDLLPGIPRVPSKHNTEYLNTANQNNRSDLLAITPTSGAALPIPGIDPTPANMDGEPHEIYDDSDADSVATEGCDEDPNDDYGDDVDDLDPYRSGSMASDLSWTSNDSHLDSRARECMDFMKDYVNKIFDPRLTIIPVAKSRFGELCQHGAGRLWFARYINAKRVNNQKVTEHSFFQLVQYFAIVLFECNEHEDYGPAKTLMNVCFTFYHEVDHPTGPSYKHFLYSYLKDQPIWQSVKFWNAAYFDAIMVERSKPVPKQATASGDDREYQRNIVFGQLGTFTCNMRSFGLGKELCLEFLRKQSVVANLKDEQIQMLRDSIDRSTDINTSKR